MSHPHNIEVAGIISAIFGHRFIVTRDDGTLLLADLGPEGLAAFPLHEGQNVSLVGEKKPSELKVSSIANNGGAPVTIARKEKDGAHADPAMAKNAVEAAGFEMIEPPRRKPKHFDVLARKDGIVFECHVGFDGKIRNEKPARPTIAA